MTSEEMVKQKVWCTIDGGKRSVTLAHHEHFVLRWAKLQRKKCIHTSENYTSTITPPTNECPSPDRGQTNQSVAFDLPVTRLLFLLFGLISETQRDIINHSVIVINHSCNSHCCVIVNTYCCQIIIATFIFSKSKLAIKLAQKQHN